jgi:transposase
VHNVLCDDAKPPQRAWTKYKLQQWLTRKGFAWDAKMSKAELLELALSNVPPKRYVTNTIAQAFDVEILRLPVKHCTLNPIELAWTQLKSHVRNTNVNFRLSDVEDSALDFIAAVDEDLAQSFIEHTYKIENIFKAADAIVENDIEPQLIETDEEEDSEATDDNESDISE